MNYSVRVEKRAENELGRVPAGIRTRLVAAIDGLASQPFTGSPLRGPWKGFRRVRIGDYRVVYRVVTEQSEVQIIHVRHRRDVYMRPP